VGDGDMNAWNAAVLDVCWVTRRLCEMMYYSPTVKIIPTLKRSFDVQVAEPDVGRSKRSRTAVERRV